MENLANIHIFDVVIVALVAFLGLKGLFRGFISEFFGLVGIVGGVYAASRVAKDVGDLVNSTVPVSSNENTLLLIGFVVTLSVVWIGAMILGKILSGVFNASGLGFIDRIAGLIFGAGKIFLLFSIIIYALMQVKTFNKMLNTKFSNSITFPLLLETGGYIIKLDKSNFTQTVKVKADTAIDTTVPKKVEEKTEIKEKETKTQSQEAATTTEAITNAVVEKAADVQKVASDKVDDIKKVVVNKVDDMKKAATKAAADIIKSNLEGNTSAEQ